MGRHVGTFSEHQDLTRVVAHWRDRKRALAALSEAKAILDDPSSDHDLRALALEEAASAEAAARAALERLVRATGEADDEVRRDALVEIQAGVGGDEAALFVETLLSMYLRYARSRGWSVELDDASREGRQGGLKSVSFSVKGDGAFGRLRWESGIHRVQRFSETAAKDVMHTSAAAVVVLPEVEDPELVIRREDVRVDKFSSGGPGGQNVNKTISACRLVHEPTGIVVQCQDERSLTQNLERAWARLAARVQDHFRAEKEKEADERRRALRGRGTRCEKVRTYNYPQDRVTDHRVPVTVHGLDRVLSGKIDPLIDALVEAEGA